MLFIGVTTILIRNTFVGRPVCNSVVALAVTTERLVGLRGGRGCVRSHGALSGGVHQVISVGRGVAVSLLHGEPSGIPEAVLDL